MPAARPSKASVENALSAVAASGFAPTGLRVASDGSFEVASVGVSVSTVRRRVK